MREDGVLKPEMIARPIAGFPKMVIGVFHKRFIDIAAKRFQLVEETAIFAGMKFSIYSFEFEGTKIGLYLSCEGSLASSVFMEEIISHGAKQFLFFGSCGAINSDRTHNRLIVPQKAYCTEGVARHYGVEGDWSEAKDNEVLAKIFDSLEVPYITDPIWTTSSPYRETPSMIEKLKEQGCVAVDMECASLMAVATWRNAQCFQFLYTEDKLDGPQWERGTLGNMKGTAAERYFEIALRSAFELSEK